MGLCQLHVYLRPLKSEVGISRVSQKFSVDTESTVDEGFISFEVFRFIRPYIGEPVPVTSELQTANIHKFAVKVTVPDFGD